MHAAKQLLTEVKELETGLMDLNGIALMNILKQMNFKEG
jgi:hypothetical protein